MIRGKKWSLLAVKPGKIIASQLGQGLGALGVLAGPQKACKCWQSPSVSGAGTQHGGFVNRAVPAFDAVVGPRGRAWSVGVSCRGRGRGRLATASRSATCSTRPEPFAAPSTASAPSTTSSMASSRRAISIPPTAKSSAGTARLQKPRRGAIVTGRPANSRNTRRPFCWLTLRQMLEYFARPHTAQTRVCPVAEKCR